jgi:release factor glutamine methyltransferase
MVGGGSLLCLLLLRVRDHREHTPHRRMLPGTLPRLSPLATSSNQVYEPSDDSFLFVDVLCQQSAFLSGHFDPGHAILSMEIGGGSGVLSATLCQVLVSRGYHLISDVNPSAALACLGTMALNQQAERSDVCLCNLADALAARLDVLLFNPPYVPTADDELGRGDEYAAWAGGKHGRVVLDQLLQGRLDKLMAAKAIVYILAIEENRPQEICSILQALGFSTEIVARKRARNERLCVIRGVR